MVQGKQGRSVATRQTLYKSWAALEQDAQFLWSNAQYYNEERSPIYKLAGELRVSLHLNTSEFAEQN